MNLSKLREIVEDRGAWHATVHGVAKSWTLFSNWTITKYVFTAKKYFWRPWDVWSSSLNILFVTPWTAACQFLCHPLSPRFCSNSCRLSQWCYLTISSSATLFPICLQSFRALGYFPRSRLFVSGGQCTGVSASATVLQWVFRVDFL